MNIQFKHYKGGIYTLIGIGNHTENSKELVAYYDSEGNLSFTPSELFFGTVIIDGESIKRFEKFHQQSPLIN